GVAEGERQAQFRCVMVLVNPEGEVAVKTEGICAGAIAMAPRGEGGFGYDPVFLLPERGVTMAEVEAAEKNRISHRAQAMGAMRPALLRLLGNG
ncbi:MAG TPA: non-canonical purine NTP pyrophosphatase, partial [Anaerolineae bacterium]|nr:non-canonical purine NTP pyrophosphatase [Anaerolineae bacterium]